MNVFPPPLEWQEYLRLAPDRSLQIMGDCGSSIACRGGNICRILAPSREL